MGHPSKASEHPSGWLEAGLLGIVVALGVTLRLPAPGADDLFYSGAAFSLAEHGTLRNPLLDGQLFPCQDFLIYPPFYQYLLAGWLRVTGISTVTMVAFQQFWFGLAGLAFSRLLRQQGLISGRSGGWAALFAVGLNVSLGSAGMRPEICSFALLFVGFALRHLRHKPAKLFGWTLVFCSLGVTTNVLPYLLLGVVLLGLSERHRCDRLLWQEWPLLIGGGVISSVLFVASIGGRLTAFAHGFWHHASRNIAPPAEALHRGCDHFWHMARQQPHYWLALALAGMVVAVALRDGREQPIKRFRWPLKLVGAVLITLFASVVMNWIRSELRLFTATFWTLSACAWLANRGRQRLLWVGPLTVWALCLGWQVAPHLARFKSQAQSPAAELAAIRQRVVTERQRRYLVDSWSAREVFDYRLPTGSRDWLFSEPFPALWPRSLAAQKPDEIWIISGAKLRLLLRPLPGSEMRTAFSFAGQSVKYHPHDYQVMVIEHGAPIAVHPDT